MRPALADVESREAESPDAEEKAGGAGHELVRG
jgi:hypothetical protein